MIIDTTAAHVSAGTLSMVVFPHNLVYSNGYDSPALGYTNIINTGSADLFVALNTTKTNHPMSPFGSFNPGSDTARFTSYRVVRTGIRVYPLSNITVRAGVLTVG